MALGDHVGTDMIDAAPKSFARRGACPTLARPMPTGDGLLARLRPRHGCLTLLQFQHLAEAAEQHGNGILEITARGSLQIRGLKPETVELFAAAVDAAEIVVPPNPVIELPPLHGAGFGDVASAAGMEAMLRSRLEHLLLSPSLAPKLAIIVDGGGRYGLGDISADIRLLAISPDRWLLAIGGDGQDAVPLFIGAPDAAVDAVGTLLDLLLSSGWQRRCRDIARDALPGAFPLMQEAALARPGSREGAALGIHHGADRSVAIGLRPRFGQLRASELISFVASIRGFEPFTIRPAPGRCFFIAGLSQEAAEEIRKLAMRHGLSADSRDPRSFIATCAGAGACASAFYVTKWLAEIVTEACPDLLDGSLVVHLSGCAKGCAHPRRGLTLAGTANGYNLVLDGLAADMPDAQIAGSDINSAIEKLARLIKSERQAGESARACLGRLGNDKITRVLRQE